MRAVLLTLSIFLLATVAWAQEDAPPQETEQQAEQDVAEEPAPPSIPPQNARTLREAPPRPSAGDFEERARTLFDAIKRGDASAAAADIFFPADAFELVKGVADPARVYRRLIREFGTHVAAGQRSIPADAEFVRFQMSRRCSWVERRQEANALPYWSCRHNWVHYRVGERAGRFKVRTLITWGERWYVTHLGEFH